MLTAALFAFNTAPLFVLGDVITEFLQNPDPTTLNKSFKREEKDTLAIDGAIQAHYRVQYGFIRRVRDFFQLKDDAESLWLVFLWASLIALAAISNRHLPGSTFMGTTVAADNPS